MELVPYRYRAKGREDIILAGFMPPHEAMEVIEHARVKETGNTEIEGFPIKVDGRYFHESLPETLKNLGFHGLSGE